MATFTNQAALSYNGIVTNSNITTGEIIAVLSMTKTALSTTYDAGGDVTYVISIRNTGSTPYTDLTLTDNLGAYEFNTNTLVPLTYIHDSILHYVNGALQPTPTITSQSPLTVTGITIPANGNATIIYETDINSFAPLGTGAEINNTASITGNGVITPITAEETISASTEPFLTISKAMSPNVVSENGELTYTFTIQNFGSDATTVDDDVVLTDTFNPVLKNIDVTYNGGAWVERASYNYDTSTGLFTTLPGQITVPGATFTQDINTGMYITTPGIVTITVTGTI